MDIITIMISTILGAVGGFFFSFLNEKGKNFATKEDIAQITRLQAAVESEFTAKHENLRAELDKQSHKHKLAFEREFPILYELWGTLIELRTAALGLRPLLEAPDPSVDEEERKQKRLSVLSEKFQQFRIVAERNKPFYPVDNIHNKG